MKLKTRILILAVIALVMGAGCQNVLLDTNNDTSNALQARASTGSITYQKWDGISGTSVSDLTGNSNYPDNPSSTTTRTSMEAPSNIGDSYGARLIGTFHPPETGNYYFWIAADDNCELWLASNKIAGHTDWTSSRQWNKFSSQKSAAKWLDSSNAYSIMAIMKEGGGGDNMAVGWRKPSNGNGSSPVGVIPGSVLSEYSGGGSSGGGSTNSINSVNVSMTVTAGSSYSVSVDYESTGTHDIAMRIEDTTDNWRSYGEFRQTVNSGSGTVNGTLNIASNAPAHSNYQIQTIITEQGGWWNEKFDNLTTAGVTVSSGGGGGGGTGKITYQKWNSISGTSVSALTGNSNYPDNPSSTTTRTSMEAATNIGDNYGARLIGTFHPPETGNYYFWIAADDNCELWLASNKIAGHTDWTSSRQWNKFSSQKSAAKWLDSSNTYSIMAIMKEGGGGDNMAVGWRKPSNGNGSSPVGVIPGSVLSEYSGGGSGGGGDTYTLTVNNGSGDGSYTEGTVVNIAADAPPAGQVFDNWSGNTGIVSNVNDPTTTVTIPTWNTTLTANYSGGGSTSGFNDLTNGMLLGSNLHGDQTWTSDDADLRIFRDGVNWSTTSNPWNPAFLDEMQNSNYKVYRFMDWQSTNWSKLDGWWERSKKTDDHRGYAMWQGTDIAIEWMIDLCNRTNASMWVCMPHRADNTFIKKFAQAVKYGTKSDGQPYTSYQSNPWSPPLNSNLKVMVEYSNETWNHTFTWRNGLEGQNNYVRERGVAMGLPGQNEHYQGQAYHALRSIEIWQQWKNVWGTSSRVVRVHSQGGNQDLLQKALDNIYKSGTYNPNHIYPDVLAINAYIGNGENGGASDIRNKWNSWMDDRYVYYDRYINIQESWNASHSDSDKMVLCSYEGGQHFHGDVTNPDEFHNRWEAEQCYKDMLNRYDGTFAVFAHFVHAAEVNAGSAWGSKRGYNYDNDYKWKALRWYLNNNQGSWK